MPKHLTPTASIASHALRIVTIAKRPSSWARDGSTNTVNQNYGKAEYFCLWGLTRDGVICPSRRVCNTFVIPGRRTAASYGAQLRT
jgi:hypothetical protein